MEQFAVSIKMKYENDGALGHKLFLPKGIPLPESLRVSAEIAEVAQKKIEEGKLQKCANCGTSSLGVTLVNAPGSRPPLKYKCSKTGKLACSFDCYKANLAKFKQ